MKINEILSEIDQEDYEYDINPWKGYEEAQKGKTRATAGVSKIDMQGPSGAFAVGEEKKSNNNQTTLKEAYKAYLISNKSRKKLLDKFGYKYPDLYAHHITYEFGVPEDADLPPTPENVEVVGYADNDESLETFVVSIDGQTERLDGSTYHITWSLDKTKGAKPVHSNNLIKEQGWKKLDQPIPIEVVPRVLN